jgi:F-type H+-transporting ATPase subunit a
MTVRVFGDPVVVEVGPLPITETMLTSAGVSLVLIGLAACVRFLVLPYPHSRLAFVARFAVSWLDHAVAEIIGRPAPAIAALAGSLFLFILACNLSGHLPGVDPPTGSLTTTSALATCVFFAVPVAGIRARGLWGYIKHYFSPNPLLFPLHLVSELSRTVALAMRLFGNIMSGHLVVGLLVALAGVLVPMPFMALDILIGLLQAYIFAVLATVFIGAAIGAGEKE